MIVSGMIEAIGEDCRTHMHQQPNIARCHVETAREFPITGWVERWYFRQREVSNSDYLVEGSDAFGRTISRPTAADPDAALAEIVAYARSHSEPAKLSTAPP